MRDWTEQPEAMGPQSEGAINNVKYGDPGYPTIGQPPRQMSVEQHDGAGTPTTAGMRSGWRLSARPFRRASPRSRPPRPPTGSSGEPRKRPGRLPPHERHGLGADAVGPQPGHRTGQCLAEAHLAGGQLSYQGRTLKTSPGPTFRAWSAPGRSAPMTACPSSSVPAAPVPQPRLLLRQPRLGELLDQLAELAARQARADTMRGPRTTGAGRGGLGANAGRRSCWTLQCPVSWPT